MVTLKKLFLLLFFACLCLLVSSQVLPYTTPVYQIRKDSAVSFGNTINYCGNMFELKMNIYKPIGDNNLLRPVIIFVHGGAFTSSDDFNEYHMNVLAQEFAKRGYVAASLDYREGHHLFAYGVASPAPIGLGTFLNWDDAGRLFVADSAEVVRSLYRAQQDVKGAVRFMKQNHVADSTAICKVFIAGHSAGGITVTAAAFMDQDAEKSPLDNAIADVPNPNWISGGFDFFGTWVITQINGPQDRDDLAYRTHNSLPFNYDVASCYTRPDLGSVNGSVNVAGGYDASVIGVASLCGAVLDTTIFSGPNQPAFYMYHIPIDIVVPFTSGYPFTYTADLLSPAPYGKWPVFYGSNWMKGKLQRMNYPAAYNLQVYDNGGNITNSHNLLPDDIVIADSIATFFAKVLDTSSACSLVVLPIGLEFNASKQGSSAVLKWSMSNTNIEQFIIQRSTDGNTFFDIKAVTADPTVTAYTATDPQPLNNVNYYRLKIIYTNNRVEYSLVRVIVFSEFTQLRVFPNPANSIITVIIPKGQESSKQVIEVINSFGQLVLRQQKIATSQAEIVTIKNLPTGIYTLLLSGTNGAVQISKFSVVH